MALRKWAVTIKNGDNDKVTPYWTQRNATRKATSIVRAGGREVFVTGPFESDDALKYRRAWESLRYHDKQRLCHLFPDLYLALRLAVATGDPEAFDDEADWMTPDDWELIDNRIGRDVCLAIADGITVEEARERLHEQDVPGLD